MIECVVGNLNSYLIFYLSLSLARERDSLTFSQSAKYQHNKQTSPSPAQRKEQLPATQQSSSNQGECPTCKVDIGMF